MQKNIKQPAKKVVINSFKMDVPVNAETSLLVCFVVQMTTFDVLTTLSLTKRIQHGQKVRETKKLSVKGIKT